MRILVLLSLLLSPLAWGKCVVFNGTEYCDHKTTVTIGTREVPVNDPHKLLAAVKKTQVKKVSLWDIYEYPPVIVELSSQLDMTPEDLIVEFQDETPAWNALYELSNVYSVYWDILHYHNVSDQDIDKLMEFILHEINSDIERQLGGFTI